MNLSPQEEEIDLIDLLLVLWLRKVQICIVSFGITSLVALHQFFLAPEIFRSEAKILPLNPSGTGGMLTQLGGLANFVGMEVSKSENTTELILKSRSLAGDMVDRVGLKNRWGLSQQESVIKFKEELIIEISNQSPLITVAWEDESPDFAKELVSETLAVARERMRSHASKKRSHQVDFLDKRVAHAYIELKGAEEVFKNFQLDNEGIEIEKQAEALINQIHALEEEQHRKEVDLEVSRKLLKPDAPEIKRMEWTVAELEKKKSDLIGMNLASNIEHDGAIGERRLLDIPKIGLEYTRKMRAVELNQKLYGVLLEQLELAKIEAQKDVESFDVIDLPFVPEARIRPRRTMAVVASFILSVISMMVVVFAIHYVDVIKKQRESD